jgi:hypothetical protein
MPIARRKGVGHYRPTAHDRKRLDRLEALGYTQTEVLAAIDRAFDTRPPDDPAIRMFSYCATVALARRRDDPPHPDRRALRHDPTV